MTCSTDVQIPATATSTTSLSAYMNSRSSVNEPSISPSSPSPGSLSDDLPVSGSLGSFSDDLPASGSAPFICTNSSFNKTSISPSTSSLGPLSDDILVSDELQSIDAARSSTLDTMFNETFKRTRDDQEKSIDFATKYIEILIQQCSDNKEIIHLKNVMQKLDYSCPLCKNLAWNPQSVMWAHYVLKTYHVTYDLFIFDVGACLIDPSIMPKRSLPWSGNRENEYDEDYSPYTRVCLIMQNGRYEDELDLLRLKTAELQVQVTELDNEIDEIMNLDMEDVVSLKEDIRFYYNQYRQARLQVLELQEKLSETRVDGSPEKRPSSAVIPWRIEQADIEPQIRPDNKSSHLNTQEVASIASKDSGSSDHDAPTIVSILDLDNNGQPFNPPTPPNNDSNSSGHAQTPVTVTDNETGTTVNNDKIGTGQKLPYPSDAPSFGWFYDHLSQSEVNKDGCSTPEFTSEVWDWWVTLQPKRQSLGRTPPLLDESDAVLNSLDKYGKHAWPVLLACVKWWAIGLQHHLNDDREEQKGKWVVLVKDMTKVFEGLQG
ncbi:hypothetical protein EV359DRAFT_76744 [Lentinula novae-zelandiae]|nr:hypothetical protein EV359DRAFT_76744 [Lentinula novae-zelandiae]